MYVVKLLDACVTLRTLSLSQHQPPFTVSTSGSVAFDSCP